jgi:hypothetical protein
MGINKYIPYIIVVSFIILIILIISFIYIYYYDVEEVVIVNKREHVATQPIQPTQPTVPINKVCLTLDEYDKLKNNVNNDVKDNIEQIKTNHTIERDYKVLNDPLYPPLNRSDNRTHTDMVQKINRRDMYIRTNDLNDTYRLVAYLTNNSVNRDTGGNSWKLFARQKDRHISDFYMKPTDNNNDIKIPLTDEIVVGSRLRDIYNIPSEITFNSPMLNNTPYYVMEVPKADLTRSNNYI